MLRVVSLVAVLFLILLSRVHPATASEDLPSLCGSPASPTYFDDLSGMWSPCATAPGKLVAEATYLQNASSVGGTAMAAYPLITLRTGIVKDLSFVFNSPSQIAESGLNGAGLYPRTRLGYGLSYTAAQGPKDAVAVFGEVLPPVGRFSTNETQSRYLLGVTSDFALSKRFSIGFFGTGTSSRTEGFERIFPSAALKASYDLSPLTQVSTDLGSRVTARHESGQSFSDVGVNQMLRNNFALQFGVGTTFNAMSNSKAHYLASGLSYAL